jgi:tRNA 2-thiouridine synthesizing protein A
MRTIDTRGLSCPQPVLMTKKSIEPVTKSVEVLVDNDTAMNNVIRFLKSAGFVRVETSSSGDDTLIVASR